ncbi:rRNA maturation RNase YbeY [Methylophaga sulfidovorans]|uniref:Endoribonuclease YbeY n=1 Tax=Methylophaga sulfidovorans TaxID=45496 RepID=A0A1I3Y2L9_9GAMM|nr:rRNA maturation RNase YbeY [Methylophaga sulfidovorans]SFK26003.1 probable rRNA maturation factor [Methylophaga sulfidovorans]
MSVIVDFQCAYDGDIPDEALFTQWAEAALFEVNEDCELSIRLVDESESAELNGQYRGKNKPTNVLSFPFDAPIKLEPRLLGDLVICVPVVRKEAQEQGKAELHHWAHMVIHGCLHLLGYDHIESDEAEQMETLEINILHQLDIANPYEWQGVES